MIGPDVPRADGVAKVTGSARYAAEWPVDRVTHAVIVQSTIARGTITSIETTDAEAAPGVLDVMTAGNAPSLPSRGRAGVSPPSGRVLSLLQDRSVRYHGEPIAVVVAESLEEAVHAASLVRVSYRVETPLVDFERALPHAERVTDEILGQPPSVERGDVAAGRGDADTAVDRTYTTPLETHNPLEPHATIAEWDDQGHLTLHDSTQYVYGVKRFVAKTLGLGESDVRVISKFVGGAFGSKGSAWSHVVLAAMAARRVRRPVKIVLTRRQMFGLVGARPYTAQRVALGARRDGTLTSVEQDVTSSTSTFEDWVEPSTMQTRMLYAVPNLSTVQRLVRMNLGTPTFNRGPGESSGTFGLESAMDELAAALRLDPIALRMKNYAEKDPESGRPWSSKALGDCYALGAERIGWGRRRGAPRSLRDGDRFVGLGMATATYPVKRQKASARVRLDADGQFTVEAATHELGTGTYTILRLVAAEALGVPGDRVRIEIGDSAFPEDPISAGSMTAASVTPAVSAACEALRRRIETAGAAAGDRDACRRVIRATGGQPLDASATVPPEESPAFAMNTFGAVFVEVHVNLELPEICVKHVVGAYGAGRILSPRTARSQIIGGIVYGLGMALTERTDIDGRTGRYLNSDLAEYLIPVNTDVPDIDVIFVDEEDPHVNALGVKGIGEVGTTGVAAAVANAVYHATAIRIRDLPITIDRLLMAIARA